MSSYFCLTYTQLYYSCLHLKYIIVSYVNLTLWMLTWINVSVKREAAVFSISFVSDQRLLVCLYGELKFLMYCRRQVSNDPLLYDIVLIIFFISIACCIRFVTFTFDMLLPLLCTYLKLFKNNFSLLCILTHIIFTSWHKNNSKLIYGALNA